MSESKELWKTIYGHIGYEVSSVGRVRSIDRLVEGKDGVRKRFKGKILRPCLHKGYYIVKLGYYSPSRPIHRLMAISFLSVRSNQDVDHRDGNRQNNLLSNLRVCTHALNTANKKKSKSNTSGFKGVYWHEQQKKWFSSIGHKGKQIYIGMFLSKNDAAKAYDEAAIECFGEFARTN